MSLFLSFVCCCCSYDRLSSRASTALALARIASSCIFSLLLPPLFWKINISSWFGAKKGPWEWQNSVERPTKDGARLCKGGVDIKSRRFWINGHSSIFPYTGRHVTIRAWFSTNMVTAHLVRYKNLKHNTFFFWFSFFQSSETERREARRFELFPSTSPFRSFSCIQKPFYYSFQDEPWLID